MAITKDKKRQIAFGENLKKIRLKKGLTLRDIEAYSGIDNSDVSKIERGENNPTLLKIFKLAAALEIHPRELFDFDFE